MAKEWRHLGAYGLIVQDGKMALIRKSRGADIDAACGQLAAKQA